MDKANRYHPIIVILHWVMAVCFILMLASGIALEEFITDKSLKFKMFQWHKSLGVLLLIAFWFRLLAHMMLRVPALPKEISKRDQMLAKLGHVGLYAFMFALPMSGWLMVSSSAYGLPTVVFDMFTWPHFPGVAGNKEVNSLARESHGLMAYAFIGMIVLHVAALVVHKKREGLNLLKRMSLKG